MSFPILTAAPITCPEEPVDDTIKSPGEAGYVQARSRFNRRLRKFGPIKYILGQSDWDLLKSHSDTVKGSVIFQWIHPTSSLSHDVRYSQQPKCTPIRIKDGYLYDIEFSLEEV